MEASAPPRLGHDAAGTEIDFDELRREHKRWLERSGFGSMAQKAGLEIDDVVQHSMEKLWTAVAEKGEEIREPRSWLARASHNWLKNQLRNHLVHPTMLTEPESLIFEGEGDSILPEDRVHAKLSQQALARLSEELDETDKKLLLLADAGLSAREAAKVIKTSKSTCHRRLKALVEQVAGALVAGGERSRVRQAAISLVVAELAGRSPDPKLAKEYKDNLALHAEVTSIKQAIGGFVGILSPAEVFSEAHHTSLFEQGVALVDKGREFAYTHMHRLVGGDAENTAAAAGGGFQVTATKVMAICSVAAVGTGGAYCAVNKVTPASLVDSGGDKAQAEQQTTTTTATPDPTATTPSQPVDAPKPARTDTTGDQSAQNTQTTSNAPGAQANREVGIEPSASTSSSSSSSTSSDFGAPTATSSGAGGGSSGGGFGIEK